jgi:hypothetical protein
MAHPIRPDSVVVMDNFYTTTVYEKGAEVIRMTHTLLGERAFRRGMDAYFANFDGQAVTCDDFRVTMAKAAENDGNEAAARLLLSSFGRWYDQHGTPRVEARLEWVPDEGGTAVLHFRQSAPQSMVVPSKPPQPFVIPIRMGFFDESTGLHITYPVEGTPTSGSVASPSSCATTGTTTALQRAASDDGSVLLLHGDTAVLEFEAATLRLRGVPRTAVPSLLRGLSAPVHLHVDLQSWPVAGTLEDCRTVGVTSSQQQQHLRLQQRRDPKMRVLAARMVSDADAVSRYDAAQQLGLELLRQVYTALLPAATTAAAEASGGGDKRQEATAAAASVVEGDGLFLDLYERVLDDDKTDLALRAQVLSCVRARGWFWCWWLLVLLRRLLLLVFLMLMLMLVALVAVRLLHVWVLVAVGSCGLVEKRDPRPPWLAPAAHVLRLILRGVFACSAIACVRRLRRALPAAAHAAELYDARFARTADQCVPFNGRLGLACDARDPGRSLWGQAAAPLHGRVMVNSNGTLLSVLVLSVGGGC